MEDITDDVGDTTDDLVNRAVGEQGAVTASGGHHLSSGSPPPAVRRMGEAARHKVR